VLSGDDLKGNAQITIVTSPDNGGAAWQGKSLL
jgi:hypothetical protein